MNANCQLCNQIAAATNGGAIIAPTEDPKLNHPTAIDLSLAGNHSLVAFNPAGIIAASEAPTAPLVTANPIQLPENAVLIQNIDHNKAKTA